MHCLRDFKFDILSLKSREKMKIVDWRFFTVGYIPIKRYNIEWRGFFSLTRLRFLNGGALFHILFLLSRRQSGKLRVLLYKTIKRAIDRVSQTACWK